MNQPEAQMRWKWISPLLTLAVCLQTNGFLQFANDIALEKILYKLVRKDSSVVLTLSSETELPTTRLEKLDNGEGFVLHFSRRVEVRSDGPREAAPLLVIPSHEGEETSLLVLSPITGVEKSKESASQISFSISLTSGEMAKYYGDKSQSWGKVLDAVDKAKQTRRAQEVAEGSSPPTSSPIPQRPADDQSKTSRKRASSVQTPLARDLPSPLKLSGSLAAGYFHANSTDGFSVSRSSVLNNVRLNLSGYLHHPRFLSFEVKPQLSFSRQSSESLTPDGRGVSVSSTFLSGSVMPLTLHYTRLNRQLVTFGTLDRLSGLEADSSQSSLGLLWQVNLPRMPQFNFTFSRIGDHYKPLTALTSQVENRARIFSAQVNDKRWGWQWNSEFRVEATDTDLLNAFDPRQRPFQFTRRNKEFRVTGTREITPWLGADFFAGRTISKNEVDARPFDQNFNYFYGNLRFRRAERLSGTIRGGRVSNLVGFQLGQTLPSPFPPSSAPRPSSGATLLDITQARSTLRTFSGTIQYALTKDLRVDSQLSHNSTRAPAFQTIIGRDSTLNSLWSGLSYSHKFNWWQLQARYAANVGRFKFGQINDNRTVGHTANAGVTLGSPQQIELTLTLQGNRQTSTGTVSLNTRDGGGGLAVSRALLAGWSVRGSYDLSRNSFHSNGTQFNATLQSWLLSALHRRIDISFSHQIREGLSFQPDLRLGIASASQAQTLLTAIPTLVAIPSNFSWTGVTISVTPIQRFTGRFIGGRNQQLLAGGVRNHFTQWEATAGYRFRLLNLDFGYINHDQNFGPERFSRSRLFFRVVRDFQLF